MTSHAILLVFSAKPVTCVDWHSSSPGLLASGGDDCLVKLWKPSVPESSDEESDEDED